MKRVVVCLFGGILLSLATAWAATLYTVVFHPLSPGVRPIYSHGAEAFDRRWTVRQHDYAYGTVYGELFFEPHGEWWGTNPRPWRGPIDEVSYWSLARVPPPQSIPGWAYIIEVACGWPLPAWKGEYWTDGVEIWDAVGAPRNGAAPRSSLRIPVGESRWAFAFVTTMGGQGLVLLPFRPLMPGAVVSVAMYTAILYALRSAIDRVILFLRRRRRRLGDCEGCGYELRDLAQCPECGLVRSS